MASSCTYTFPEVPAPSAGEADFSKIVSVGNSITAGYANGALYNLGQSNSYASIIAQQLATITPSTFNQPDVNSPLGNLGTTSDGTPMGRLILVNPQNPLPTPIIPGDPFDDDYEGVKSALNNFGVPGLRLIDADKQGYALDNRFYKRFALDINNGTVINDATNANGTFFTFWLGNNDVLGFATTGATGNESGDGSNSNDLISLSLFESKYEVLVGQLLANGAKGIIANIANVTDIPFFTTVPYDFLNFDGSNPEDTLIIYNLNQAYVDYNNGLVQAVIDSDITEDEAERRKINFTPGANGVILFDEDLTVVQGLENQRMANDEDLLTMISVLFIGQDEGNGLIGTETPLGDEYVLTAEEQELILKRTADFNTVIQTTVNSHSTNLALIDMNTVFKEFAEDGVLINGSGLTSSIFPPYGGFSLDGTHPNPRGAAFIANQFIEAINQKFGATIPMVNPNNYPGNEAPILQ